MQNTDYEELTAGGGGALKGKLGLYPSQSFKNP